VTALVVTVPSWVRRAAGGAVSALGLLGVCMAVSVAGHHAATEAAVAACCRYFPERLARGQVWTVVGSAFFLPDVRMVAPTTLATMLLFFPYAVAAGARPALRTFFTGHVVATVAVAAVVLPGAALGWPAAVELSTRPDIGASAGLAAVAGAACVRLGWRRAGPVLLAVLAIGFGLSLARGHRVVDVEHLLALATGAVTARRPERGERGSSPASSS
jgi:hypothetical protein